MTVPLQRHRFTVDEVLQMAEHGTLPDVRVQLIDGDLIEMAPQGPEHAGLVSLLADVLRTAYPSAYRVRASLPIVLPGVTTTLPEPDLAVVLGDAATFRTRHPRGDEAVLIIEIAVTSQNRDTGKAQLYGAAGVEEYWLVDVPTRQVHRYSQLRNQGGVYGYAVPPHVLDVSGELELPLIRQILPVRDLF